MKKEKTIDDQFKDIYRQLDEIDAIIDHLEKAEGGEMLPERVGTA